MIELIIPFYGDPGMLRETVESVLAQTDSRWRLHVVDDHYPDPSASAWVGCLADPRVRLSRNEANLGVAANFAQCLTLGTSDLVAFVGCDDVLEPGYVAAVLDASARHPNAALIQPRVEIIDSMGVPAAPMADRVKAVLAPRVHVERVLEGEPLASSLLRGNWAYFPAIAWRRRLIADRSFRPDMETVLDLSLLLDLVLEGHQLVMLGTTEFRYRRHEASASSVTARNAARFVEEETLFHEVASSCDLLGWHRAARAARWHLTSRLHAMMLAPGALFGGDRSTFMALSRHALHRDTH
jgi:glycosyltransferase involved in cell wall biosynthesis